MAQYTQTNVTLTANQAASIDPCLVTPDTLTQVAILCNMGLNAMLLVAGANATAGFGLPIPPGGHIAIGRDWPDWDNDIYVLGTTGDKLTVFMA